MQQWLKPLIMHKWNSIKSINPLSTTPSILQRDMYVYKVCSSHWKSTPYAHCSPSSDMDQPKANCSELITKTADALNSEILQQLLISVQQNGLTLCKQYAINKWVCEALEELIHLPFTGLLYLKWLKGIPGSTRLKEAWNRGRFLALWRMYGNGFLTTGWANWMTPTPPKVQY